MRVLPPESRGPSVLPPPAESERFRSRIVEGIDFREYLGVLLRRWWLIVIVVLICTGVAWLRANSQEREYRATATVLLKPRLTDTLFTNGQQQPRDAARAVATEIQVVTGAAVRSAVADRLGVAPPVSARPAAGADVLAISAESTNPVRAAAVANAYAQAYLEHRRVTGVTDVAAAIAAINARIAEYQAQIDAIDAQVAASSSSNREAVATRLAAQRANLAERLAAFRDEVTQLQLGADVGTGGAESLSAATVPSSPIRPNPLRSAAAGFALGLALAVFIAYLWDGLDNPLQAESDLREIGGDLPVLALIPKNGRARRRSQRNAAFFPIKNDPSAPIAEAYRSLRTGLVFAGVGGPIKVVAITSPLAGEGKTSTTANLAAAFAEAGYHVLAVSCDLRRPKLHAHFGLENEVGLSTFLEGGVAMQDVLQSVPGFQRLKVIASGPNTRNPSELLGSKIAESAISTLRANADVVLLDCPPVLPVTDAVVLGAKVDGVVLQVSANMTTRRQLARTLEILRLSNTKMVGTVLNRVEQRAYGYGYATDYYKGSRRYEGAHGIGGEKAQNGAAAKQPTTAR